MDSFFFFIVNQLAAWKTPSFIFSNTRSTTGSRFSLKLNVPQTPLKFFIWAIASRILALSVVVPALFIASTTMYTPS